MNIIIYEDEGYKNFLPLTWTRPVYDLKCGVETLAQKIVRLYPKTKIDYSCRYYLPGRKVMNFEKGLFVNGRLLATADLAKKMPLKGPDEVFMANGEIVAVRASTKNFDEVKKKGKVTNLKTKTIKYPWELIADLADGLRADWPGLKKIKRKYQVHKSAVFLNDKDIFLDNGVEVEAGAVLDARHGPIYVGKGTIVRPLTYLKGPLSIGPNCRLGGEIGESIFHGYINKQHYGFIGHSYVGEWVNLGAGTTNSDLKNNYGTVKVQFNGKPVDSQEMFVGCFIGDFAKTGIGTLINTGTLIGIGANVLGGRPTAKVIPNFAWDEKNKYRLDDFLHSAKIMMGRRSVNLGPVEAERIKKIYKLAA